MTIDKRKTNDGESMRRKIFACECLRAT
jgi:hypothetical protein